MTDNMPLSRRLRMLWGMLVASPLSEKAFSLRIVALPRRPLAKGFWLAPIILCAIVEEDILWQIYYQLKQYPLQWCVVHAACQVMKGTCTRTRKKHMEWNACEFLFCRNNWFSCGLHSLSHLWVDALLLCGTVFAFGFGIAKGRPILWGLLAEVNTILVEQLDHLHSPINSPEQSQVRGLIHVVWVCTSSQKGFGRCEMSPSQSTVRQYLI